jgi:HAE1 family hydrophobic/amphiphilic exporter-1
MSEQFQEREKLSDNRKEELTKEADEFSKTPWVFLVKKNKLTYLIIAFLIIFGVLTIRNIPRELTPEVEIPIAIVSTVYPGASPVDVERQVTDEIEKGISNLEGVKQTDSTSSLGISSVVVEFEAGENVDDSIRNLRDEVEKIKGELPQDAFDPQVIEISFSDQPIFAATISSESYDGADLKKFAENIENELESIPYVSDVQITGGRERVIVIDLEREKMSQKGLSANQVLAVLSANNINFPLGSIDFDNFRYSVRLSGEFQDTNEIASLRVGSSNGKPILLADIAEVKDGFSQEISRSRLSVNGQEARESVTLQLYKKTGGDILNVAKTARETVEKGRGIIYPENLEVEITSDMSVYINESIATLFSNGAETVLIILGLLFVFLGWREALVASLSVPFSFFVSFIIMAISGESLNFLSLFALVLALGLLVDSSIVIVEGMYRYVGHYGLSGYQAAILTIKEYAGPLLSGMLTTVAAFFPLMFVKGIIGDFIKTIPIVVNSTLIAALFVALTIVPAIGALIFKPVVKTKLKEGINGLIKERTYMIAWICRKIKRICASKPRRERRATKIFDKLSEKYYAFLPKLIAHKKNRRKLYAVLAGLFLIAILLPISGVLKVRSFGQADAEYFYINVEMPKGTLLDKTDEVTQEIEEVLMQEKEVVNFTSNIGAGLGMTFTASSGEGSGNQALILVNLTKKEDRDIASYEIVKNLRDELKNIVTEGKVTFTELSSGPPSGSPIELRVVGEDLDVLEDLAEDIKRELASIPTVVEAETSVKFSAGEFVFYPNKDILLAEGLSVSQVAQELRNGIARNDDLEITKDGEQIVLDLGYKEKTVSSFSDLEGIMVQTTNGEKVALSELGEIKIEPALSSISHRDDERVVTVSAKTEGGNATEITNKLKEKLEKMDFPAGYRVDYGGEQQELDEIFQDMLLKMVIGIILILFILVIQFNSYRQVLIIMVTIPLALIGVFFGMTAARLILDIPAFVGIVSLVGIVVNNAIILIDQMNKEIAKGQRLIEAARKSGYTRLRPIFLTSITTIFGLLPLSITQPDWRNMGFTIIFGLTFSAFLTLFVIPSVFVSFYEKKIK